MHDTKKLLILTGPTAVGKTELSLQLAKRLGGSIISADSMQVYRHMDIGTAKIQKEEMRGIPHYLIDELEPDAEFSVATFKKMALAAMADIRRAGRLPILAGGTGFYIQAVLKDVDFDKDGGISPRRLELEAIAEKDGADVLHRMLTKVDPVSARRIHPNNIKRVIRALEFYEETGTTISNHNETQKEKTSPYTFGYFVLDDDRERLYQNIDRRVDAMLEDGLLAEVRSLLEMGYERSLVSMQGIGYRQLTAYLAGEVSFEEAVYNLKRDTRHFAKRQLTWFRREPDVIRVDKRDFDYDNDRILEYIMNRWEAISNE